MRRFALFFGFVSLLGGLAFLVGWLLSEHAAAVFASIALAGLAYLLWQLWKLATVIDEGIDRDQDPR